MSKLSKYERINVIGIFIATFCSIAAVFAIFIAALIVDSIIIWSAIGLLLMAIFGLALAFWSLKMHEKSTGQSWPI